MFKIYFSWDRLSSRLSFPLRKYREYWNLGTEEKLAAKFLVNGSVISESTFNYYMVKIALIFDINNIFKKIQIFFF